MLNRARSVNACRSDFFVSSRAAARSAISRKISQSSSAPSGFSNTAGVKRAVLRTASKWKTRSYWSRSRAVVGGSTTSA